MILKQFYLGCLAHASYIVIDESTKTAAVIDPQRDVEQYIEEAERHGARIEHVLLTHFHADFIAGHLELRERLGARIYLGRRAGAEYEHTPLAEGDTIELGAVQLRILETPGHTPEGISILVFDTENGDAEAPHAVFTGDTLFVGDVGRPDLLASVGVTADELAGMLYDSLREKLLTLPDETLVYPAHGAGSMCGKNLSSETFSTIGKQRAFNYALQPMSKEAFAALVTADQPQAPQYFVHDAVLNRKERATLTESLARGLKPLTVDELVAQRDAGTVVLDVRGKDAFAAGHLKGSLNVGLDGRFATWSGTAIAPDASVALIVDPGQEHEAAMRLGRIGLDKVAGFLEGGFEALRGRSELLGSTARITPGALSDRIKEASSPLVLDVRGPGEWNDAHIEGSLNLPLPELAGRLDEVPRDRELAVVCKSGYRSMLASSLLERAGLVRLVDVEGGMDAWQASDLPTVVPV